MMVPKIDVIEQGTHPDADVSFAICRYEEDDSRTVRINITAQALQALAQYEKMNNVDFEMNIANLGRVGAEWAFKEFGGSPPKEVTIGTNNYKAVLDRVTLTLRSSA